MFIYVFVVLVSMCIYPWWRYRRARRLLSQLPCLPTLPIVGNLHQLMGDGVHVLTRLTIVSKTMDYQRSPLVFWLGPIPLLGISCPDDVKKLSGTVSDSDNNVFGMRHTSTMPLEVFPSTRDPQDIFNAQARKLVELMKTECGKEPFDHNLKYFGLVVLETFCEIVFGMPTTGIKMADYQAMRRASESCMAESINMPGLLKFLYGVTPRPGNMAKGDEALKNLIEKMLIQTKTGNDKRVWMNKDILLAQKQRGKELYRVLGGGHQVVANALAMSLLLIGCHPSVQDRLYEEMDILFGNSNRAVSSEDLSRMQYCEAAILETLRLYPFAPLYFVNSNQDLQLDKCTIPQDTICWINIWGSCRSRNIWGSDADSFRPERWLENPREDSLVTFYLENLTGLGKVHSLALLKTSMSQILRELVISSNIRNLRFKMSTVLQPINGHFIRVSERSRKEIRDNYVLV